MQSADEWKSPFIKAAARPDRLLTGGVIFEELLLFRAIFVSRA